MAMFNPASSPATSPTATQKKLHADALQRLPLRKRGEQNQERGDKASDPAAGTCHNTPLKQAPGNRPERHSRAPKSDRALWCSTHGTLGLSKTPSAAPLQSTTRPHCLWPLTPPTMGLPSSTVTQNFGVYKVRQAGDREGKLRKAEDAMQMG